MTKQLLKMAFLLLALVGGVSSAWASTVDDLATISSDYTFIGQTSVGAALTSGSLYDSNRIISLGGSGYATNKGTTTIEETAYYNCHQIKNARQIAFKVSGACTLTLYGETNGSRKWQVGSSSGGSEYGTSTESIHEFSITSAGVVYINCDGSNQLYLAGFKVTFPAADAPTITTQPASAAYNIGATPADLTVVASASAGVLSYQWYKNTDQDKTAKEADKIAGATSATLDKANISTASENTTYYYVVVTDGNGSTTSDLATITVVEQEPYATPTITEKNGTVQITSSDDITVSQIKYSLDGGSSWNTYSIPFNLATPTTVKAKVVQGEDPSYTDSEVASTDCNAIHEKIDGSFSITLYNDDSNWTKTASQDGSSTIDTWTGKADTYLDGYIIALDNEGKTGSNIKALSTGNAINSKSTIKNSNGRRIKFTIPTGVKVNRITIYSYTNGDSDNKYASTWSFDGETPDMIGLSLRDNDENNGKSESSASNPDIRVFYFDTPLEGSFYLNNSGYQQCFYMVLDYTQTVSATITSSRYASFSSTYALDFSGVEGLEAYIATSGSETTVSMEQVDDAAAGTGLVLKGDAGTYNIPVVASATDHSATNRLWAITSNQNVTAAGTGWTNYVLAKQNDNVVFAPVTGENSVAVTAGHAALCLANPSGSRAVSMVFGGEATGIDNLTPALSEGEGVVYNLRGQRVAQPTKGLYIVNGKKVVIK